MLPATCCRFQLPTVANCNALNFHIAAFAITYSYIGWPVNCNIPIPTRFVTSHRTTTPTTNNYQQKKYKKKQALSIVWPTVIFTSTRQRAFTAYATTMATVACARRKEESIRMLILWSCPNCENSLPNIINDSMNWLVRILAGRRSKWAMTVVLAVKEYENEKNACVSRCVCVCVCVRESVAIAGQLF